MSKTYQTILYDWDGSIANSLPEWLESYHKVFADFAISLEDQQIIDELFVSWEKIPDYGVTDMEIFGEKMAEHLAQIVPFAPLQTHAEVTVKNLRALGKKHAIVTSSGGKLIHTALHHNNLTEYFDIVINRDDVTQTKPHPEPLFKAMTHLAANPETTLMIGDSHADIGAGKAAGVTTVVYYPKENERFYSYEKIKSLNADHIIREFYELEQIAGKE